MKQCIHLFLLIGILFPNMISAQDEPYICRYLFASSNEVTKLSTDAISLAVDAVWGASEITGVATITGTLTQNQSNPDVWTYSSSPHDKLVLNFATGQTVIFTIHTIDGYTGGTEEDFKLSHVMDFSTYVPDWIDMRIQSNTYPEGGKTYWQRTITGTVPHDSKNMTVNISHTGNLDYYIEPPYAYYKYVEQASGSSSTAASSVSINEVYRRTMMHNSDTRIFIMNTEIENNSSGNFGGTTYQYQNAYVFWAAVTAFADSAYAGYYNNVIDAHEWEAHGIMVKNGQSYGTVQFNGPVINGTYGPDLVLRLGNGTDIFLHPLIGISTTTVHNKESRIDDFVLMQNYPNPFNPVTKIEFKLNERSEVILEVFTLLGQKVDELVNGELPAGMHSVHFDARSLPGGTYFYRITAGEYIKIKPMILLK